jgi:anti-anti-sigma factor
MSPLAADMELPGRRHRRPGARLRHGADAREGFNSVHRVAAMQTSGWVRPMKISISEFGDIGKRVTLVGRLDIFGAEKIEAPLKEVAGSGTNIVIDMEGVDFIASNSVRHLVVAAKTVAKNSRKLVLLYPRPLVVMALIQAGLIHILPIAHSEEEARAVLSG